MGNLVPPRVSEPMRMSFACTFSFKLLTEFVAADVVAEAFGISGIDEATMSTSVSKASNGRLAVLPCTPIP